MTFCVLFSDFRTAILFDKNSMAPVFAFCADGGLCLDDSVKSAVSYLNTKGCMFAGAVREAFLCSDRMNLTECCF